MSIADNSDRDNDADYGYDSSPPSSTKKWTSCYREDPLGPRYATGLYTSASTLPTPIVQVPVSPAEPLHETDAGASRRDVVCVVPVVHDFAAELMPDEIEFALNQGESLNLDVVYDQPNAEVSFGYVPPQLDAHDAPFPSGCYPRETVYGPEAWRELVDHFDRELEAVRQRVAERLAEHPRTLNSIQDELDRRKSPQWRALHHKENRSDDESGEVFLRQNEKMITRLEAEKKNIKLHDMAAALSQDVTEAQAWLNRVREFLNQSDAVAADPARFMLCAIEMGRCVERVNVRHLEHVAVGGRAYRQKIDATTSKTRKISEQNKAEVLRILGELSQRKHNKQATFLSAAQKSLAEELAIQPSLSTIRRFAIDNGLRLPGSRTPKKAGGPVDPGKTSQTPP